MNKKFTSLGLMSGTSGDGVDASVINSDGKTEFKVIKDEYFEYDQVIRQNIHDIKEKIHNINDLKKYKNEINDLERVITLFHAKVAKNFLNNGNIDFIGFHGQTIYHNSKEKISKQIGNGKLFSELIKKTVIFNFRQNDIKNGGEGAPLSPLFHQLIATQNKIELPICIMNIGGISNITVIHEPIGSFGSLKSRDIGPGNCLIDTWIRKNSTHNFDKGGLIADRGVINEIILEQAQELFANSQDIGTKTYDVNDFDVSFTRGLSLEDGAKTLTDFTGTIIGTTLTSILLNENFKNWKILICGGGRKNKTLIETIKKNCSKYFTIEPIDNYGVNGDFVESQAFAFLSIRTFLKLPLSFPSTTGCKKPTLGGEIVEFK